jgi:Flp pilus assembly protein TadD
LASEWHDKSRLSSSTLSTDPDAFFSYNRLGEAMLRRGDYKTAVMQFREQLYSHPDDAHARRRLAEFVPFVLAADLNDEGVALVRAQDAAAAVARFERAIAVRPDFIVPYKNLAAVLPGLNRHAEARAYRERAERLEARSSRR